MKRYTHTSMKQALDGSTGAIMQCWRKQISTLKLLLRDETGSEMVEVAVVLPLYLLTVFGCISAALSLFIYIEATYAARRIARNASMHSAASNPYTQTDLNNLLYAYVPQAVSAIQPTITPAYSTLGSNGTASNTVGNVVTITIRVDYPVSIPFYSSPDLKMVTTAQEIILN